MSEGKRIFANKKRLMFWFALFLLQMFLFIRENTSDYNIAELKKQADRYQDLIEDCSGIAFSEAGIMLTDKIESAYRMSGYTTQSLSAELLAMEQISYLISYHEYLAQIQERAIELESFRIFSNVKSFSYRNIKKTADDFMGMQEISLKLTNHRAWEAFYKYNMSDYLLIAAIIPICLAFFEERKKGLWSILHSSFGGRMRLAGKRCGIIAAFSMVFGILQLFIALLISGYLYGGFGNTNTPIQSIQIFQKFTSSVSVGQFFCYYMLLKLFAYLSMGLLIWMLFTLTRHMNLSMLLLLLVFSGEYLCYRFIPVQSIFVAIKYINVFSILDVIGYTSNYLNLNILKYPVSLISIQYMTLLILLFLTIFIILLSSQIQYPVKGTGKLNQYINRMLSTISLRQRRISGLYYEYKKILIGQKGLILITLFIIFMITSVDDRQYYISSKDAVLNKLYIECKGMTLHEAEKKADMLWDEIKQETDNINAMAAAWEDDLISYEELSLSQLRYQASSDRREAYEEFIQYIEYLKILENTKQIESSVLNPMGYKVWFGEGSYARTEKNYLALMAIIVCIHAGCFCHEHHMKMQYILKATSQGYKKLLRYKLLAGNVITAVLLIISFIGEMYFIIKNYQIMNLYAPIQCIPEFYDFPYSMSIIWFVLILYIVRLLILFCITIVIQFISDISRNIQGSVIISVSAFMLPALLAYIGIELFDKLSAVSYLEVIKIIDCGRDIKIMILAAGIFITAGICSFRKLKIGWNN